MLKMINLELPDYTGAAHTIAAYLELPIQLWE